MGTSQLINDENLRQQADKFSKGEEIDETCLVGMTSTQNDSSKDDAPPVKKFKKSDQPKMVTKDGEQLMGDASVYQHLEEKQPTFLNNLKTILKPSGDLKSLILKSVNAEFLFAEKQVFPCKVEF